jgi:hypothetical protein
VNWSQAVPDKTRHPPAPTQVYSVPNARMKKNVRSLITQGVPSLRLIIFFWNRDTKLSFDLKFLFFRGVLTGLGAFIILMSFAIQYSFSNLNTYVTSYLRTTGWVFCTVQLQQSHQQCHLIPEDYRVSVQYSTASAISTPMSPHTWGLQGECLVQ